VKLKIGITFRDDQELGQTWYGSGLSQNLKFLYDLLELLGHEVSFVVNTDQWTTLNHGNATYRVTTRESVFNQTSRLDVLVEAGMNLNELECTQLRDSLGVKVVSLRYGHVFYMDVEGIFTAENLPANLHTARPDMVWTSPHFSGTLSYLSTLYDAPARVSPYIWEPDFVETRLHHVGRVEKPSIYVMEPNISVLKNALIPMAVLENVFRSAPDSFDKGYILNSMHFYQKELFLTNIAARFSSLQGGNEKVYFSPRDSFSNVFKRPDILLGHQHECELNYLYNEALYTGVPLVHNSPAYKDLGYYYHENNVEEGAESLTGAINSYVPEEHRIQNETFLQSFSIRDTRVQEQHALLLEELMDL